MAGWLGVDVGGTKVALRVEGDGRVPVETAFRWLDSVDAATDVELLAAEVGALRERWADPVDAIGIALPATVNADGHVTSWPGRPAWRGLDLAAALRTLFPDVPVAYADDGDLAALAEAHETCCANLVYVGVGTGVGGGIVLDGRPCPGPGRGSCELGHVVIDRSGPRCDCGRYGCVQAVASGPATLRRAGVLRGADVAFADLATGLAAGDEWARAAVTETAAALATVVVDLSELLHPDVVVLGGGFAAGVPELTSTVADQVALLTRPGHRPAAVRAAALGGLSSLYGAVQLARSATVATSARAANR